MNARGIGFLKRWLEAIKRETPDMAAGRTARRNGQRQSSKDIKTPPCAWARRGEQYVRRKGG